MISTIAEHSVDLDLLPGGNETIPSGAKILDIGCLGFAFTNEMRKLGHEVYPIDIQMLESIQPFHRPQYFHCGISDYNGSCWPDSPNDKQATRLQRTATGIPCWTLQTFSQNQNVKFWDLIKMDVEGEEFKIIMSLEKAPAKQLSIEFHLHTGIYGQTEMRMMEDKLKALGYEAISHEYEARHCAGFNYWDSLFVLK